MRAKEAAKDARFAILLPMYVDGLWIQRGDCRTAGDFQPVLDEITRRTGLPIALHLTRRTRRRIATSMFATHFSKPYFSSQIPNHFVDIFLSSDEG